MKTEYWLLLKSDDGRVIRYDGHTVLHESGSASADAEVMEILGERLIREARAFKQARKVA